MISILKAIVVFILTLEARLVLWRYKPRIIAVTGSVGKTSTKDAIHAAIARHIHVRKNKKTLNSEIGVPLTILGCDNAWSNVFGWMRNIAYGLYVIAVKQDYPEWLILEVGADRPGDIKSIARWLRPDIAVLTSIPDVPAHVEFFSSPEEVAREKRELITHLKRGGSVVVNGDEPRTAAVHAEFRGISLSYGFSGHNDFHASHDEMLYEGDELKGMRFRVNHHGSSVPVSVYGGLGKTRIYSALAALAVAKKLNMNLVTAAEGLREWVPAPGRMRILPGLKGSRIIDDTYNSSPVAARAALDTLINIPTAKKRIAVLGDMLELGKYTTEEHRAVGKLVAECANQLVTVGFRARHIAQSALDHGMKEKNIRQYELGESQRAGKELENDLGEGVVVLVKGSQSIRMERTVLEIMNEPQRAEELLVRQDAEWLAR